MKNKDAETFGFTLFGMLAYEDTRIAYCLTMEEKKKAQEQSFKKLKKYVTLNKDLVGEDFSDTLNRIIDGWYIAKYREVHA